MTREEQREQARFKLVWRMVAQAWRRHPHAFERGASRETLCSWVYRAAVEINREVFASRAWKPRAVFAPGLTPKELRRVLLAAEMRGLLIVDRRPCQYTKFFMDRSGRWL